MDPIIHCYTQNRKSLGLVVLEKRIFFFDFFPIVTLWELSVLIRYGSKPNATYFPHPNDASDKI